MERSQQRAAFSRPTSPPSGSHPPVKLLRSLSRTASGVVVLLRVGPVEATMRLTTSPSSHPRASARRGSAAWNWL